jgi:hypothetical protein
LEEQIRPKDITDFRIGFTIAYVWFESFKMLSYKHFKCDLALSSPGSFISYLPMRATCPANLIVLDLIITIMFGEEYTNYGAPLYVILLNLPSHCSS